MQFRAASLSSLLRPQRSSNEHLKQITIRIDLQEDHLTAQLDFGSVLCHLHGPSETQLPTPAIIAPIQRVRRGGELKLVLKGAAGEDANPDPNLIKVLLDARRRHRSYTDWEDATLSQIATTEDTDTAEVSRSLQLAFLAPDLVGAILDGRQTPELTATKLKRLEKLPLLWEDQRALLT